MEESTTAVLDPPETGAEGSEESSTAVMEPPAAIPEETTVIRTEQPVKTTDPAID